VAGLWRLSPHYTAHGFQEFLARQGFGDDLPDIQLLGCCAGRRQSRPELTRDGDDRRARVSRLDIAQALRAAILRHVDAHDHQVAGAVDRRVASIADTHAIAGLPQPLLEQVAGQEVFLVDDDVQGVLHKENGRGVAWRGDVKLRAPRFN
jgi:hypothetical protein